MTKKEWREMERRKKGRERDRSREKERTIKSVKISRLLDRVSM